MNTLRKPVDPRFWNPKWTLEHKLKRLKRFAPRKYRGIALIVDDTLRRRDSHHLGDKMQILALLVPHNLRTLESVVDDMIRRLLKVHHGFEKGAASPYSKADARQTLERRDVTHCKPERR
jgi:hypothetical protein